MTVFPMYVRQHDHTWPCIIRLATCVINVGILSVEQRFENACGVAFACTYGIAGRVVSYNAAYEVFNAYVRQHDRMMRCIVRRGMADIS